MLPSVALLTAAVLATAACGGDGVEDEILVSAAASLTDAFGEVARAFEAANPGTDVVLNLAGSSALREQILEGAPADVFASANRSNMDGLVDADAVTGEPRIFARNRMQIAVPAGNPAGVEGLDDLGDDALLIGLCAEEVPCGGFGREVLANAGVDPAVDTDEPDVRSLLTKLELGELDAGLTYVTDVVSAGGGVEGIEIPDDVNVVADYPIAVLAGAPNPDGAAAFVEFVLSGEGAEILRGFGFDTP
ncbi:MAG: molybdate ABC transporter substrate-binding protein [Acidimicrobiia bacterium]